MQRFSRHSFQIRDRSNAPSSTSLPFADAELRRLPFRRKILRHATKGGIGAEIGVFRGLFSEVIARTLEPTRLYLVDPWTKQGSHFPWRADSPMTCQGKLTTQAALDDTKARMKKFPNIDVRYVEDYSFDFFDRLNEKLDWVYLDSSHSYDETLRELHCAAAVLRSDGVIFGDDWRTNPTVKHSGVMRAVNTFLKETDFLIIEAGIGQQFCLARIRPYNPKNTSVEEASSSDLG